MKIKLTALLVSAALCLVSCGDSLTLAEGGMTGTGITAGRITGFGSIYVNGIHYDVDNALFYRDGKQVTDQASFAAGEFITVTGSLNSDGVSGIASQVKFDGLVKATVEAIATDGSSIQVLGQTIQIDLLTVLHGFDQVSDLQLGNLVEVSGDRLLSGAIKASSISLLAGSYQTTEGLLIVVGAISSPNPTQKTFQLNRLIVDYSAANLVAWNGKALADGEVVQVEASQLPVDNVLIAEQVSLQTTHDQYPEKSRLELEGSVSAITSASQFTLAGQTVVTNANTQYIGLSANNLALGLTLEVEGNIDTSGNLQATRVILRDVSANNGKELAGQITAIDQTLNTISLAGYTVYLDHASMLLKKSQTAKRLVQHGGHHEVTKFEDLAVGDYIEVTVIQFVDGTWHVLRLDRGGRSAQPPH